MVVDVEVKVEVGVGVGVTVGVGVGLSTHFLKDYSQLLKFYQMCRGSTLHCHKPLGRCKKILGLPNFRFIVHINIGTVLSSRTSIFVISITPATRDTLTCIPNKKKADVILNFHRNVLSHI